MSRIPYSDASIPRERNDMPMGVGDVALPLLLGYDKFLKCCMGGAVAGFLDADTLDHAPVYWFENRESTGSRTVTGWAQTKQPSA
jgi:hypothetical protein